MSYDRSTLAAIRSISWQSRRLCRRLVQLAAKRTLWCEVEISSKGWSWSFLIPSASLVRSPWSSMHSMFPVHRSL